MVILVKGASMALAIAAMLIVEWLVTDELLLPPLVVFATVALVSVGVADSRRSGPSMGALADACPLTSYPPKRSLHVASCRGLSITSLFLDQGDPRTRRRAAR